MWRRRRPRAAVTRGAAGVAERVVRTDSVRRGGREEDEGPGGAVQGQDVPEGGRLSGAQWRPAERQRAVPVSPGSGSVSRLPPVKTSYRFWSLVLIQVCR